MKFLYKETAGVSVEEIRKTAESLLPYVRDLKAAAQDSSYTQPEHFLHLPYDESYIQEINALAVQYGGAELKHIFLVGIGGSSLGARAVYEAQKARGAFAARAPQIHFLDTIDPNYLETLPDFFETHIHNPNEFLILYISKSGTTTEPAINFDALAAMVAKKFSPENLTARTIAITNEDSPLWKQSKEKGIATIRIPACVGGRHSVFSAAGLLPLALSGISITDFLGDVQKEYEHSFSENLEENSALVSAAILFHYLRAGYAIHDVFLFSPELEALGKWYRQFSAESLGKGNALLPEVSIGTNDLHATAQLYLEGPKNRITTFVWLPEEGDVTIPDSNTLETVEGIAGKTPEAIRAAIYEGVKRAYIKKELPFMEIELSSSPNLGAFMATKILETLFLARLVGVNAFNQPAVELYKEETRRIVEEL